MSAASFRHIALALLFTVGSAAAQPIASPAMKPHTVKQAIPVAIFGEDDRHDLAQSGPQSGKDLAEKVGILSLSQSSYCTAFCVSGDVIATASHCLLGTEQSAAPDLERVSFSVGHGQRVSALAGADRIGMRRSIRSGTSSLRVTRPIAAASDWAVARLAKPVCTSGGLSLTAETRAGIDRIVSQNPQAVSQVAMHRDLAPDRVVMSGPCTIRRSFAQASEETIAFDFANAQSVLMHTCDTGAGSSGSPLLIEGAHGPEVIGINVGTYVISRTNTNSSSTQTSGSASEAIANTAVETARFKAAVEEFTIVTGAVGKGLKAIRSR